MGDEKREIAKPAPAIDGRRSAPAGVVPASSPTSIEATFQALLEAAPDAIVIVDGRGRIVVVNSQTERLFGYRRDELIDQPVELLLPAHLHDMHIRHRARYTSAPRTRPMGSERDLAALRKDGSTFPVEISLSALTTDEGLLITSVIRDTTQRKLAEQALARQASRLREQANLLELVYDAIIVRDPDSRIIFWNHGAEQQYGWPRDSALGQISHELLQTSGGAPMHKIDKQLFADGRWEGELIHTRRDGSRVVVASRQALQRDEQGTPIAILEINNDITQRKRAAEELEQRVRQRTAHLNTLLQFSQDLLSTSSLEAALQRALGYALALAPAADRGAIYLYEPASQRLALRASAGFSPLPGLSMSIDQGILGETFTRRRVCAAASAADWARPEIAGAQGRVLHELHLATAPGGAVAIPLVAHDQAIGVLLLLSAHEGELAADARLTLEGLANLAATSISEERSTRAAAALSRQLASLEEQQQTLTERVTSAEAAMLQAARLAAVGQLAASIAHEINNPLYATRNCLYLLYEDLPPDLRDSHYLNVAREQLGRIAGIIDRMRQFSRPNRGELAPADLNQLLEGTLALAVVNIRHTSIRVIFSPDPQLPEVICNGDQLRQVFLNLILNASDAMPQGGTLTIRTVAGPTVAVVEVQDTGVGIPADLRPRLFEPFFTNKAHGTGLGLSISAHIVTQHGGQIEVDSVEGQGSTFRVALPYRLDS